MTVRVRFTIKDINGQLVTSTQLAGKAGVLTESGSLLVKIPPTFEADIQFSTPTLGFEIFHPDYHPLEINMQWSTQGRWLWDNPVCRVTGSATNLEIVAVLGRARLAPTQFIPEPDLVRLSGPPQGVLLTEAKGPRTFRALNSGIIQNFIRIDHPIVGDPSKQGWDRLRVNPLNSAADPNPLYRGRFRFIEYGGTNTLRPETKVKFLIGVWFPLMKSADFNKAPDFIVFNHPSPAATKPPFPQDQYPFGNNYPYALLKTPEGRLSQSYPELVQRYFFQKDHFLAYQMLAQKRGAVLVMPVDAFDTLGPLDTRAGLYRLLRELCHVLHAEYLTTELAPSVDSEDLRPFEHRSRLFGAFEAIPNVGKVATAAFSNGVTHLDHLLVRLNITDKSRYPADLFASPSDEYDKAWSEIWDLDCSYLKQFGRFDTAAAHLVDWFLAQDKRCLRLYHSHFTTTRQFIDQLIGRTGPLAKIVGQAGKSNLATDVAPIELHEPRDHPRWSVLITPEHYIDPLATDSSVPHYGSFDEHHFVPNFAFGHAVRLGPFRATP